MTATTSTNAVLALTALWASRPGLDASVEQVAAWYGDKARVHELLAAQASEPIEAAAEQAHAVAAYEHARRLLLDACPRPVGAEAEALDLGERADTAAWGDSGAIRRTRITTRTVGAADETRVAVSAS